MERHKTEILIMVDCEYSGDIPGDYSLLSIGATVIGQHEPPFHKAFYVELKPLPDAKVDLEAMAVNQLDLRLLAVHGLFPAAAMSEFAEWVRNAVPEKFAYPVMVADGQHDFMYIRWYFSHFNVLNPFVVPGYNPAGHSIDMKSMLTGKHPELRISQTRRASVIERFPQYRSQYSRTHRADEDVIEQADRFQKMRGK